MQNLGDEITKQLRVMRDAIAQGLDSEIKSIRDEVGHALKTKEQGEEDAKKTGADLRRYSSELNSDRRAARGLDHGRGAVGGLGPPGHPSAHLAAYSRHDDDHDQGSCRCPDDLARRRRAGPRRRHAEHRLGAPADGAPQGRDPALVRAAAGGSGRVGRIPG
ncbi:hypothetical protein ACU686_17890 [Yinghuangia aomiensis]